MPLNQISNCSYEINLILLSKINVTSYTLIATHKDLRMGHACYTKNWFTYCRAYLGKHMYIIIHEIA